MDICQTVAVNGASFVARTTSFDKRLPEILATAIQNEGFSLVEAWELCTAYYVPNNHFSKSLLESTLRELNFPTGIIHQSNRPEYSQAYRQSVAGEAGKKPMPARPIQPKFESSLERRMGIVIAGAAGKKINSAATLFCRGAMLSGLWVTQRNDYPVTVKSGHSVSEVILAPMEIGYTGISKPDVMVLLFKEGLSTVRNQLKAMTPEDTLVISSDLLPIQTQARIIPLNLKGSERWGKRKEAWVVIALARVLSELKIFPPEAFKEAVSARAEFAEDNLAAIEAGEELELG
jgi:Pyruvate/2-oxoacid:ferredoxin oxidoreductase gamma subunit